MDTAALVAAIAALSAAIVCLYRRLEQLHDKIESHLSTTISFLRDGQEIASRRDAEAQRDLQEKKDAAGDQHK